VHGRGRFASLEITVNQTKNLTDQAVSLTWTGGDPTTAGPTGRFGGNFLQVMQCWGEDDGTVADNPGPPPEQCEQGAVAGSKGGRPGVGYPAGFSMTRLISRTSDWSNYVPGMGPIDPHNHLNVYRPFHAVDGTAVDIPADETCEPSRKGCSYWQNQFYNLITTNELAGAPTGLDHKGAELMEVVTGNEAAGLGCGRAVQPVAGGGFKVPKCWLVIVPRGTPTEENQGTPFAVNANEFGVVTSPVSPAAWQHRIAVPLEFSPVDSPCVLGADERRISGSELALPAVANWQPALCTGSSLPPFSYAPVSDSSARQQLLAHTQGSPGMAVVSRPISTDVVDPANPVVYAPLTASGLVIGFNVERTPAPEAPADENQLAGVRVADMNLTPRLVAKLLTQSYQANVSIGGGIPSGYTWVSNNPKHMGLDPDFLQFNPEFTQLRQSDSRAFASLSVPEGSSDAALQVWEWVLADPEARRFLSGEPDEFGMKVNPAYNTTAAGNSTGLPFADPVPSNFPKSDPFCLVLAQISIGTTKINPPPLCGTDWVPYQSSFQQTARVARTAADVARIDQNPFPTSSSDIWLKAQPQNSGFRDFLSLTDTPSAKQYGLQVARLSRAGDDGAGRRFVVADTAGIEAGIASMKAGSVADVLEPNPTATAPDAYPLASLTYAAVIPLQLSAAARSDYAAFIDYAAGTGQTPGFEFGQLPQGFVPLSDDLKAKAAAASHDVRTLVAPTTTTTTTTAATTTTTTAATTVTTLSASSPPTTTVRATATTRPRSKPRTTVPATTAPATSSAAVPESSDPGATSSPDTATSAPASTTAAAGAVTTVPPSGGAATGTSAPTVTTPRTARGTARYAVPSLGAVMLGSALFALEMSKRPRRRRLAAALAPTGGTP
jgi:hypothetical protein